MMDRGGDEKIQHGKTDREINISIGTAFGQPSLMPPALSCAGKAVSSRLERWVVEMQCGGDTMYRMWLQTQLFGFLPLAWMMARRGV